MNGGPTGRDSGGTVDYLCNAFVPARQKLWHEAITSAGIPLKVRDRPDDSFCDATAMVERMDELGIETLVLPTTDIGAHGAVNPHDFEHLALHWGEAEELVADWPGRFAALAVVNPSLGMAGVRQARDRLDRPWVLGCYVHTHSWDRRLDHADYYPYYALCSEADVPVVMQAGISGGLMTSECGRPISLDRAAVYFPSTRFVLSHTGWPWVDEAVALALKFPNVSIGTASYPPSHWSPTLVDFLRGPGRGKVIFGTNFPTVGHRHALGQIGGLDLPAEARAGLLGGNARSVFTRL